MTAQHTFTVVNVEDEHAASHTQLQMLRDAGYRVLEATSVAEALSLAEQEQPVLVLLHSDNDERFRTMADDSPGLMWMNSPDGCEFVNRAYLGFLGVSDVDVRGFDWAQYVHPDDRKGYVTAYLEAVVERRLFEATFRFRRHDGEYRWMKSIGTPRFGADGGLLGYVGSTIDVTDIQTGHIIGRIAMICEAGPEHTSGASGTSRGDQAHRKDHRPSIRRQPWFQALETAVGLLAILALDTLTPRGVAVWMLYGPLLWYLSKTHHFSASSIMTVAGISSLLMVVGFILSPGTLLPLDLAMFNRSLGFGLLWIVAWELKRSGANESALRESEERLQAIMDRAPAAIFIKDRDGRSLFMNEECARVLNLDRSKVHGKTEYELYPPELADQFRRNDLNVWESGDFLTLEERVEQTDGLHTYVSQKFLLRDSKNEPYALCGIAVDITPRLRMETALRASEERLQHWTYELEQAVNVKTAELQQSHDRLRAMATELNLAEQRERARLATELHDHLQQMLVLGKLKLGQGKRLVESIPSCAVLIKEADEVLSDALEYTRTLVSDLSPTVLRDHGLSAGLLWLSEYMQKHGLAVTVLVPDHEVTLPEEQKILLFQSVRELLINASKYASTGQATVTLDRRDGQLLIDVRDEGAGFDLAAAAAAAAAGTPTGGISSKFGLFSIQERMRALGGSFNIQSAPGQGTAARLILPLVGSAEESVLSRESSGSEADHAARRTPTFDQPTKGQTLVRVLLVDDHAMVRQGLRSVLDAYTNIRVVAEARDGAEAIDLVEKQRPHVVVMDINMPKMNGIEATAHITSRYPETIVIGISVNVGDDNSAAMLRAGAATLLTKEAAVEQLHDTILDAVQFSHGQTAAHSLSKDPGVS